MNKIKKWLNNFGVTTFALIITIISIIIAIITNTAFLAYLICWTFPSSLYKSVMQQLQPYIKE